MAIAIVRRGERFLVGLRQQQVVLPGYAEFPGGKCETGESPESCAVRECREETGLTVIVLGLRQEVVHDYAHGVVRLSFFNCETSEDREPLPPFRWVMRQELAELRFPEANASVMASLLHED